MSNSALVGAAAVWFPWVIPVLPGSSANDTALLFNLAAVGLILGVLVLLGALMQRIKPANKKAWGIMIVVFSIPSVITGGGFIIGFILGVIGGALAVQATKPATTT